jgi:membrane-bound lytic murein transglycosylase D
VAAFLTWNEISRSTQIEPETYYLLGKKRARAEEAYHKVSAGENLWDVSQRYGVRQKKLRRYNRLASDEEIRPGMTLWLASRKPKDADKKIDADEIIEVDKTATFAWTANSTPPESRGVEIMPVTASSERILTEEDPIDQHDSATPDNSAQKALDSAQNLQPETTIKMLPDSGVKKIEEIQSPEPRVKEHVVQPKETLYGIAHTYNVGVMDLVRWNDLNLQDGIRPGQILKLSEGEQLADHSASVRLVEHEVKTTDTLYSIARKYGVTIKDLMEWNNKKDFSLAIGEKLKIQAK